MLQRWGEGSARGQGYSGESSGLQDQLLQITEAGWALKNDLLQMLLKCPGGRTKVQELKHLARRHYGIQGQRAEYKPAFPQEP